MSLFGKIFKKKEPEFNFDSDIKDPLGDLGGSGDMSGSSGSVDPLSGSFDQQDQQQGNQFGSDMLPPDPNMSGDMSSFDQLNQATNQQSGAQQSSSFPS
jgi:hypothetical protein